jgi:hypothetical protein
MFRRKIAFFGSTFQFVPFHDYIIVAMIALGKVRCKLSFFIAVNVAE